MTDTMELEVVKDTSEPLEAIVRRRKAGQASEVIESPVSAPTFNEHAAKLAFNEEPVRIYLDDTNNPAEEPIVYVSVNGDGKWLARGKEYTLPRKFVEVLARARTTSIKTVEGRDDYSGDRRINIRRHTAIKYPFSVREDKNPKGAQWIRELMQAA